jgi:hypothetical protein
VDNQRGQQTKRKEMIKVYPTHAASFVVVSIKKREEALIYRKDRVKKGA